MPRKKPFEPDPLTSQQTTFCHEYLKNGGNGKKAAIAAGYAESNASKQASLLLKYNPLVREFLDRAKEKAKVLKAQEEAVDQLAYTIKDAMKEADDAIRFAILTNNANARVKALELKMKLHGLLIERHNFQPQGSFNFTILPFGAPKPIPIEPPKDVTDTVPALPEPGEEIDATPEK